MHVTLLSVLALFACSQNESSTPAPSGSAAPASGTAAPAGSATAAPTASAAPTAIDAAPAEDDSAAVARLVVDAVGSKAFGGQTIDASCVSVTVVPSGESTVAGARLKDCGDKTARSMVWVYTRAGTHGAWTESFLGTPPKCWKGIPPEIARAVAVATKIQNC